MDSFLLPVGLPGGMCVGLPGVPDGSGLVWGAGEVRYLDRDTYRLWRACAAVPTPAQLLAWAADEGIEDAAASVDELISTELLIADYPQRLDSLTMRVVGEGLGNGDGSTSSFRMKGRDGETVDISPLLFALAMSSDGATPLAELCAGLDESNGGSEERREEIVAGLPSIVRAGVVRLEIGGKP
jgi:hypothetical protein